MAVMYRLLSFGIFTRGSDTRASTKYQLPVASAFLKREPFAAIGSARPSARRALKNFSQRFSTAMKRAALLPSAGFVAGFVSMSNAPFLVPYLHSNRNGVCTFEMAILDEFILDLLSVYLVCWIDACGMWCN